MIHSFTEILRYFSYVTEIFNPYQTIFMFIHTLIQFTLKASGDDDLRLYDESEKIVFDIL